MVRVHSSVRDDRAPAQIFQITIRERRAEIAMGYIPIDMFQDVASVFPWLVANILRAWKPFPENVFS